MTPYQIAERFVGTKEVAGEEHNEIIMAMLKMDSDWPGDDSVPWCSAFVNYIAWLCRLPRSKSLMARSWLSIGIPITIDDARADSDIVILARGTGNQPGPENTTAPGHVGFFSARQEGIWVLGGNQKDRVCLSKYKGLRVLGVRRLQ
jgi:uncharacterized protein (TIGR02594 family)